MWRREVWIGCDWFDASVFVSFLNVAIGCFASTNLELILETRIENPLLFVVDIGFSDLIDISRRCTMVNSRRYGIIDKNC